MIARARFRPDDGGYRIEVASSLTFPRSAPRRDSSLSFDCVAPTRSSLIEEITGNSLQEIAQRFRRYPAIALLAPVLCVSYDSILLCPKLKLQTSTSRQQKTCRL